MCYAPIGTRATIAGTNDAGTFGVSAHSKASGANMESSGVNTNCNTDYLGFATGAHFVSTAAKAAIVNSPAATDIFRICGRY